MTLRESLSFLESSFLLLSFSFPPTVCLSQVKMAQLSGNVKMQKGFIFSVFGVSFGIFVLGAIQRTKICLSQRSCKVFGLKKVHSQREGKPDGLGDEPCEEPLKETARRTTSRHKV